jgi:hypothetical protein
MAPSQINSTWGKLRLPPSNKTTTDKIPASKNPTNIKTTASTTNPIETATTSTAIVSLASFASC